MNPISSPLHIEDPKTAVYVADTSKLIEDHFEKVESSRPRRPDSSKIALSGLAPKPGVTNASKRIKSRRRRLS